jgi:hypothetical protein
LVLRIFFDENNRGDMRALVRGLIVWVWCEFRAPLGCRSGRAAPTYKRALAEVFDGYSHAVAFKAGEHLMR